MSIKEIENETIKEFNNTAIGELSGNQVDIKELEISKSIEKEYRTVRNNLIIELHNRNLRYTEISNLQVQDIDNSYALIRIQRGDRIFRVAISTGISSWLKQITKYKDYKDYIFTKDLIKNEKLSRTMITKIIKNHKATVMDHEERNQKMHTVERVCDKYFIYKNGRVIEGLVINSITNALRICDILNADCEG